MGVYSLGAIVYIRHEYFIMTVKGRTILPLCSNFQYFVFICVGKMALLYIQDIVVLISGFKMVGKRFHPIG